MSLPNPPLLIVSDRHQAVQPLAVILEAAFASGCRWASLREKDLPATEIVELAQDLVPLARRYGAVLSLHSEAALAQAAGLEGAHLAAGGDVVAARALLGKAALIGLSVHTAAEAARLDPAVVDYAVAGPFHATASKPGYGPALGPKGIADIVRATAVPIIAIGGITPATAAIAMSAGVAGIAVMGSVMRAADPGGEVRALLATSRQLRPR